MTSFNYIEKSIFFENYSLYGGILVSPKCMMTLFILHIEGRNTCNVYRKVFVPFHICHYCYWANFTQVKIVFLIFFMKTQPCLGFKTAMVTNNVKWFSKLHV